MILCRLSVYVGKPYVSDSLNLPSNKMLVSTPSCRYKAFCYFLNPPEQYESNSANAKIAFRCIYNCYMCLLKKVETIFVCVYAS